MFFDQVNNACFYRFPVGQFSRILHTTTLVSRCKLSEQNFENFIIRGCFSKKNAKMSRKCSNSGDFKPPELRNDSLTDRRILTDKINLYGMSSFHF